MPDRLRAALGLRAGVARRRRTARRRRAGRGGGGWTTRPRVNWLQASAAVGALDVDRLIRCRCALRAMRAEVAAARPAHVPDPHPVAPIRVSAGMAAVGAAGTADPGDRRAAQQRGEERGPSQRGHGVAGQTRGVSNAGARQERAACLSALACLNGRAYEIRGEARPPRLRHRSRVVSREPASDAPRPKEEQDSVRRQWLFGAGALVALTLGPGPGGHGR